MHGGKRTSDTYWFNYALVPTIKQNQWITDLTSFFFSFDRQPLAIICHEFYYLHICVISKVQCFLPKGFPRDECLWTLLKVMHMNLNMAVWLEGPDMHMHASVSRLGLGLIVEIKYISLKSKHAENVSRSH